MCKKIWYALVMFLTGGIIYFYFEIFMRGYSHISMFLLGGLCFLLVGWIGNVVICKDKNKIQIIVGVMLVSSVIITLLELVTGMIVNVHLGLNVWDYSDMKMNYKGQICALYSGVWGILGLPCVYFYGILDKFVFESAPNAE